MSWKVRINMFTVLAGCAVFDLLFWPDAFLVPKPHRSTAFKGSSGMDPNCPVYGRFQDLDVVCVEWRTQPMDQQIPVPWLAKKLYNWSAKKVLKKQSLPSSGDLYQSSIFLTLSQDGFLEFRTLIQKCIPKTATFAIKRPEKKILRWFLKIFMKDVKHLHLECGFRPDQEGRHLLVRAVQRPSGELQRRCPVYAPYSSFQEILQKWDGKNYRVLPFRRANGNEFARDSLLWCAEQPQRLMWTVSVVNGNGNQGMRDSFLSKPCSPVRVDLRPGVLHEKQTRRWSVQLSFAKVGAPLMVSGTNLWSSCLMQLANTAALISVISSRRKLRLLLVA